MMRTAKQTKKENQICGILIMIGLIFCGLLTGCENSISEEVSLYAPSEEQRLTVYTCLPGSLVAPLVQEFQERTDIWVTTETGTIPQLLDQMRETSGSCDVFLGGSMDVLLASQVEMEEWEPLSYQIPILIYNPKLVRQNPPTGFADLLDPAWQGKVAFADPVGSDFTGSFLGILQECMLKETEELFRTLQSNLTELQTDCQDVIHHVSEGSYCLAVVPEELALAAVEQGASLTLVYPQEGAYLLPEGIGIPTGGQHRENAEIFMEFCLSDEAQIHMQKYHQRRSVQDRGKDLPLAVRAYDAVKGAEKQEERIGCWQQLWEERS